MTRRRLFGTIAAAAAVAASAACHNAGSDPNAFEWSSQLPPGTVVHLRTGAGSITVRRSASTQVVVNGSLHWQKSRAGDVKFTVNQLGRDYYVCAMWRSSGKCGDGSYRGRQTGGWLTMFSLFHRGSDAVADLVAEVPANIVVDVRTTTGSVDISGAAAGVTAATTNGSVSASNVSGPLSLVTTNGDVRLATQSLAATDSVRLRTTNGSIHAELPQGVDGRFDLATTNGVVQTDLPVPATSNTRRGRHLTGQIGTSSRTVNMRSVNGIVSVTSRAANTSQ